MNNKRIFITGGAGFLGQNLVRRYYENNEITIYSRDEAKHYYLKKEFPKVKCVIGDIRDFDLLKRSSRECDIGIFTASLKQIEAVDQNIEESVKIIINGALNSRRAAEENKMESANFISTDKSRSATTLYGSMKFVAGESFIIDPSETRLSSSIYGNVLNSTGSIIPLMWSAIEKNYSLKIYSPDMTRFMIDTETAMDLIEHGLSTTGVNVVPNLQSFKVSDLFEIFSEKFGLKFTSGEPRISEKIHEIMISSEEMSRTHYDDDRNIYVMHHKNISNNIPTHEGNEYSSKSCVVSKDYLDKMLQKYNYFKK